ncbi:MAG: hypothetical protein IKE76_10000 [Clostridia bacterium]|nr:hypothetical protein [Clostridia bacterium]
MRRKIARLMALVLLLELAVLLCACAHIACHHCAHGPECPICACVRLGMKSALIPRAILALLSLTLCARASRTPCAAAPARTLIDQKVRLND